MQEPPIVIEVPIEMNVVEVEEVKSPPQSNRRKSSTEHI
jgi:hypothetical protein